MLVVRVLRYAGSEMNKLHDFNDSIVIRIRFRTDGNELQVCQFGNFFGTLTTC